MNFFQKVDLSFLRCQMFSPQLVWLQLQKRSLIFITQILTPSYQTSSKTVLLPFLDLRVALYHKMCIVNSKLGSMPRMHFLLPALPGNNSARCARYLYFMYAVFVVYCKQVCAMQVLDICTAKKKKKTFVENSRILWICGDTYNITDVQNLYTVGLKRCT